LRDRAGGPAAAAVLRIGAGIDADAVAGDLRARAVDFTDAAQADLASGAHSSASAAVLGVACRVDAAHSAVRERASKEAGQARARAGRAKLVRSTSAVTPTAIGRIAR
jgi:hypothetical protein